MKVLEILHNMNMVNRTEQYIHFKKVKRIKKKHFSALIVKRKCELDGI